MTVAKKIEAFQTASSWIRKMFEEGARLKAEHGAANVFDFSLGNPNLEPPEAFRIALSDRVRNLPPGAHSYMPNMGLANAREAVARYLSKEQQAPFTGDDILMTCGAAGALNVILKTILDPGDEVITPAPFFVEYRFYADNHGGVLKTAASREDFSLDLDALSAEITSKTKAVIINSPNNPTGQVYRNDELEALGRLLESKSSEFDRTIYLISDEPYRKIVYDDVQVPSIFTAYRETLLATSYSKDLSIPGERIGFIAVNPEARSRGALLAGMALANRILGFVNAPALMQHVIAEVQGSQVNVSSYATKRELFCDGLADCGYQFTKPAGAFYLFPKSPIPDDVEFVRALQEELILVVPGSGFGGPGHFRIAFCVDDETITGAMPGFRRALEKFQ